LLPAVARPTVLLRHVSEGGFDARRFAVEALPETAACPSTTDVKN
jgi:hypothetical protein